MTPGIDVRRSRERFHTTLAWLDSWHSFSFGRHHDPQNTHHGLVLVSNDDRVQPVSGFSTHSHRDMEIVTWVLAGELEHRDSEGNHGVLYPGLAQRMSAGTGIAHSEMNPSPTEEAHFVQMWVPPETNGIAPGYEQLDVSTELARGGLRVVASGRGDAGAITIHQRDAVLWAGRLRPGERADVPSGPHVHLYVARDTARLGADVALDEGDAVRISGVAGLGVTAGDDGAELLIWVTA